MEKPTKGGMTDSAIVQHLTPLITDSELGRQATERLDQALDLYMGEEFPDDELIDPSRSRMRTSEVFDMTEMVTAQVVGIAQTQEDIVIYNGVGEEDEKLALQQTRMVNWSLREDNDFNLIATEWVRSGCIYGESYVAAEHYRSKKFQPPRIKREMPLHMLAQAKADPLQHVHNEDDPYEITPLDEAGNPLPPMQVVDAKISRGQEKAGIRIFAIKPKNILLSADAAFCYQTGGIDASLQGYKVVTSRSALVDMGHDQALVDSIPAAEDGSGLMEDLLNPYDQNTDDRSAVEPKVTVYEVFTPLKVSDTPYTPLMHFTLAGESGGKLVLLAQEEVEQVPIAAFTPYMVPHTVHGQGIADLAGRIQKYNSNLMRAAQDSLWDSLFPRATVQTDLIDMDDFLNDEIGALIKVEEHSAIQLLQKPYVGPQALGMMEVVNQALETRVGTGPNTMAVTPESFKKTTAMGVSQQASTSMLRIEAITAGWANTGLRKLFSVIGSLYAAHPEDAQLIAQRMGQQFEPLSADQWDTGMDVRATITYGNSTKPERLNGLMTVMNIQKEAIANKFPGIQPKHLGYTFQQIVQTLGFTNKSQFMDDITKVEMPQQTDEPDPQLQADMQKAQADMQLKMYEIDSTIAMQERKAAAELASREKIEMFKAQLNFKVAMQEMGSEVFIEGAKMEAGATTDSNISNPLKA